MLSIRLKNRKYYKKTFSSAARYQLIVSSLRPSDNFRGSKSFSSISEPTSPLANPLGTGAGGAFADGFGAAFLEPKENNIFMKLDFLGAEGATNAFTATVESNTMAQALLNIVLFDYFYVEILLNLPTFILTRYGVL